MRIPLTFSSGVEAAAHGYGFTSESDIELWEGRVADVLEHHDEFRLKALFEADISRSMFAIDRLGNPLLRRMETRLNRLEGIIRHVKAMEPAEASEKGEPVVVRPDTVRAKAAVQPASISVSVRGVEETERSVSATAVIADADAPESEQELDVVLSRVERIRESVGDTPEVAGYLLTLTSDTEMFEAVLETLDGRLLFHDLDFTSLTPHWASLGVLERLLEALIREVEL